MLPIVRTLSRFRRRGEDEPGALPHLYVCGVVAVVLRAGVVWVRLGHSFRTDPRFKAVFDRFHLGVEALLAVGVVWFVVSHWKGRIRADAV